ncbi:MAG: HDOD domain-containing protein [Gammaproteobacteria bacterium]|nr:HDOD domain-containing protein [Gammaproteobacteria bacterium]
MADHRYFSNWSVEQIRAVESQVHIVHAQPGTELLGLQEMSPFEFFLLDGQLQLQSASGATRTLCHDELDAGFPVAHLRPSQYQVNALQPSELMRIETSQLRRFGSKSKKPARFRLIDDIKGGSWQSHPLVVELMTQIREQALELPAVPGVALRIRRAMDNPNVDMEKISRLVAADPAIAGRLLKIANSAFFGAKSRCETVRDALVRMGMETAQNVIFTLATKNLFTAKQLFLKKRMLDSWRHAIDIASLSAVLARHSPGMNPDKGLLVGLLHEVGAIPILKLAEGYPDLKEAPGVLDEVLLAMGPAVSAHVLESWKFQDEFAEAAQNHSNWYRDHEGGPDYADLVVVAHLHSLVRKRAFHQLPRIDETPAFQKLAAGLLSPQLSLVVLDEAKSQIQELRSLLA